MKPNRSELIWGLVVIIAGLYFLASNLGWLPPLSPDAYTLVLGAVAAVFVLVFLLTGFQWPWLVPAGAFGAGAAALWLAERETAGTTIGAVVMGGVALPFWIAFLARPRQNWWAVIPGWTMLAVGSVVLLSDRLRGELIGAVVLFSIALPFLVLFIIRRYWWALIPAYVLSVLAVITLSAATAKGELIGALFMLAIALPFWILYLLRRHFWWALIPAGVMTSIGVVVLVSTLPLSEPILTRLASALLFGGWSLTFAFLWLRHQKEGLAWAWYPAVGLAAAAAAFAIFGDRSELVWPLALIGLGAWLLLSSGRWRTKSA
jgi:hypothetical protein